MLHHIYRSNIGVLGHGQHIFQRYSLFKPKTTEGVQSLTSNIIPKLIHQPQHARSLHWPVINNPLIHFVSTTVRYKSATTTKGKCTHPGCKAKAVTQGLCTTHAYPCAIHGCGKQARKAGGYCITHAKEHDPDSYDDYVSNISCKVKDCKKQAQAGGYCKAHAKEYDPESYDRLRSITSCKVKDCEKHVNAGGYCRVHAKEYDPVAYNRLRSCAIDGCNKHARLGGFCITHSKEHNLEAYDEYVAETSCEVDDCNKQAKVGGYCAEHAQQYSQEAYRKFRLQVNKSMADRLKSDLNFKLSAQLRTRMSFELSRVGTSYKGKLELIGCSVDQLRQYFEYNYFMKEGNEWMSWDNWGGGRCHINQSWEIDHIMPVSSFDLTDPEEVKKCFQWGNLQPLEWQDNAQKGDSIPDDFEWCYVKERWMWSETSGKINYELPSVEEDDIIAEAF